MEGKILITDNLDNVEFLVLFPLYNFTFRQQVENLLNGLTSRRDTPSVYCRGMQRKTNINKTDVFNVDWLYPKILNETLEAKNEVQNPERRPKYSIPESKKTAEINKRESTPHNGSSSSPN